MQAERGSARAQAVLGFQNNDLRWIRAAARHGDLDCQLKAAEILLARHEYQEALHWYRRASNQSCICARFHV
jgi:hypothetical protein